MSIRNIDHSRVIAKMICKFNTLVDKYLTKELVISTLSDAEIKTILISCHTLFEAVLNEYDKREVALTGLKHIVATHLGRQENKQEGGSLR